MYWAHSHLWRFFKFFNYFPSILFHHEWRQNRNVSPLLLKYILSGPKGDDGIYGIYTRTYSWECLSYIIYERYTLESVLLTFRRVTTQFDCQMYATSKMKSYFSSKWNVSFQNCLHGMIWKISMVLFSHSLLFIYLK